MCHSIYILLSIYLYIFNYKFLRFKKYFINILYNKYKNIYRL